VAVYRELMDIACGDVAPFPGILSGVVDSANLLAPFVAPLLVRKVAAQTKAPTGASSASSAFEAVRRTGTDRDQGGRVLLPRPGSAAAGSRRARRTGSSARTSANPEPS